MVHAIYFDGTVGTEIQRKTTTRALTDRLHESRRYRKSERIGYNRTLIDHYSNAIRALFDKGGDKSTTSQRDPTALQIPTILVPIIGVMIHSTIGRWFGKCLVRKGLQAIGSGIRPYGTQKRA